MDNNQKYSKSAKSLLRFFCILGIVAEILNNLIIHINAGFIIQVPDITDIYAFFSSDFYSAILNSICLVIFIILFFIPAKYELFSLIAFLYSFKIIIFNTVAESPIGFLLYLLGVSCLLYKNFYKKHTCQKIILSILLYLCLVSTNLKFGLNVFVSSLIKTLEYGVVFLSTVFFVVNFLKIIHIKKTARVWDLSNYPELTERDKEWLRDILEEKKYEDIAKESGITVGTLKNRMHQIFNIIGINDRISLLATYGGYEVKF